MNDIIAEEFIEELEKNLIPSKLQDVCNQIDDEAVYKSKFIRDNGGYDDS